MYSIHDKRPLEITAGVFWDLQVAQRKNRPELSFASAVVAPRLHQMDFRGDFR